MWVSTASENDDAWSIRCTGMGQVAMQLPAGTLQRLKKHLSLPDKANISSSSAHETHELSVHTNTHIHTHLQLFLRSHLVVPWNEVSQVLLSCPTASHTRWLFEPTAAAPLLPPTPPAFPAVVPPSTASMMPVICTPATLTMPPPTVFRTPLPPFAATAPVMTMPVLMPPPAPSILLFHPAAPLPLSSTATAAAVPTITPLTQPIPLSAALLFSSPAAAVAIWIAPAVITWICFAAIMICLFAAAVTIRIAPAVQVWICFAATNCLSAATGYWPVLPLTPTCSA
eukprot:1156673-Pelagomonas_calceolata.AAC.9